MKNNVSLITIAALREETRAFRAFVSENSYPTSDEIVFINAELENAARTKNSKSFTYCLYPVRKEETNYNELNWLQHMKALLQQRGFKVTLKQPAYDEENEYLVVTWTL